MVNVFVTTLNKNLESDVEIILDMFSKDKGEIIFKPLDIKYDAGYVKKYNEVELLSFNDIETICGQIKAENLIWEEYVVLVTDKGLSIPTSASLEGKDWNSAYVFKNIVVKSTGFKKMTEERPYLGIAHQIVENVFQSISGIKINSTKLYREVHLEAKGCINDYCKNFSDVKTKIMSGFICHACIQKALDYGVSENKLQQIQNILGRINKRFRNNYDFSNSTNTKVIISKYGDLNCGGNNINFGKSTVRKMFYLFYLINYNRILTRADLYNNPQVRKKFMDLGKVVGEDINDHRMNSLLAKASTHVTRVKETVLNSLSNEGMIQHFCLKSKKCPSNKHYYYYQVDDERNIEIDPSLLYFRVN